MNKCVSYMDCRFPKSPMAGEISPPKFRFDRFLQNTKNTNTQYFILYFQIRLRREKEREIYKEATETVILSQITPRQEQKSPSRSSFQSRSTFATLLNDALIAINALPVNHYFNSTT